LQVHHERKAICGEVGLTEFDCADAHRVDVLALLAYGADNSQATRTKAFASSSDSVIFFPNPNTVIPSRRE
jgi:hypothetical protein